MSDVLELEPSTALMVVEVADASYDEKAATRDAKRIISDFLSSLARGEKAGLPAMMLAVEHLAQHKNSTPFNVLYNRLLTRGKHEQRILAGVAAAFFGEGVLKVKKVKDGAFPYVVSTDTFARGVTPRNTWVRVIDASETSVPFNSPAFLTMLKDMFAVDKADPTEDEVRNKIEAAILKDAKKAAQNGIDVEVAIRAFRNAYAQAL